VDASRLRRLHPEAARVALDALYAGLTLPAAGPARPGWVALGMVASVDGSATREGRSGALGGAADLLALQRLRDACDVVLVGAGTIRDEGYDALPGTAARRAGRVARGLAPRPRIVIVTASGALDPQLPVFGDLGHPPLVLAADDAHLADLEGLAEVRRLGPAPLDGARLVAQLVDEGLPRVTCEGGPRLAAALLAAGRVDEVFLTLSPVLLGGGGPRIVVGALEQATDLTLEEAHEYDGDLLLRYRRAD